MTVHGEREVIPATTKAEAAKAVKLFTAGYNKAYREVDPSVIAGVETGALHTMGHAGLKAQQVNQPEGNPGYPDLELSDTKYTIPKQAGWPKFFLVDTDSNRNDFRWLLVFTRSGADEAWKAAYLSILRKDKVPEFKKDADGWAEPVGGGSSAGLAMAPGKLSETYADYLETGKGDAFAPGQATTDQLATRKKLRKTVHFWTDYDDQPARPPQYTPLALRTADGGALAFFATHHAEQRSMAQGFSVGKIEDATTKGLLTGKARTTLIQRRISESAVLIPTDGPVEFLNRLEGVTAARGR
jgi:hypothetical protein